MAWGVTSWERRSLTQEETEDVHVKEEPMMQNPLETVFVTVKEEMETEDVCVKEEPVTADPFKTEIVTVKEEFESEDDADGEWAASCSGTAFVPVEITIEDGQGCKQLGAPTTYAACRQSSGTHGLNGPCTCLPREGCSLAALVPGKLNQRFRKTRKRSNIRFITHDL
ncbi:uncharacterized protein LOC134527977 isoform X10 [Bacillus rossius redtenbacheri]|uniref:uncharacterized protein LOC134527977 isoform X10 n=1 Tax=Bacillus rossius redtenbacheri TaxID=93214 RepID=UPI002FDCBF47